jgi:hypothetical protein
MEQTIEYRQRWNVQDAEHPLGREPHGKDASLAQRQAWQHATRAVDRLRDPADDQAERGDQTEATMRSDHQGDHAHRGGRGDHEKATSRHDRPGDHRRDPAATHRGDLQGDRRLRPLARERDHGHGHERAM